MMKQMLLLEQADLARLRAGETIQLTNGLMLSLEGHTKASRKNSEPPARTWTCQHCQHAPFVSRSGLRTHMATHHPTIPRPIGRPKVIRPDTLPLPEAWKGGMLPSGKYPCKWGCGKVFVQPNAWGPHKKGCPKVKEKTP
jgi:membrane protease subunit (stomatin/prohibitin family)